MGEIRHWDDAVDVVEMGNADFEKREQSISVWDTDGSYARKADALADYWGLKRQEAIDRAIRLFLARCIDTGSLPVEREAYEITVLIPQQGWVADTIDAPLTTVGERTVDVEGESVVAAVPPTVHALVKELTQDGQYDQMSDVTRDAINWLVET